MKTSSHEYFWAACLTTAQLLQFTSTFFWTDEGRHTLNGSVMLIIGMVFWLGAFVRLFEDFKYRNPWYYRIGLLYAFYGCLGGVAFGFEGLYSVVYQIEKIGVDAHTRYPLQMNLTLFWAGPAFPLSIIVLGSFFLKRKIYPVYVSLLFIAGGALFPISRILRIEWVAHVADAIMLIPIVIISLNLINGKDEWKPERQ